MARFGRSFPTPHRQALAPALTAVSVTVTGLAAVLPHVGTTASTAGAVSSTAVGHAAVLPHARTTATLSVSVVATGHAAVLPHVGTTAQTAVGTIVNAAAAGRAGIAPHIGATALVTVTISGGATTSSTSGFAYLNRARGFRAVPTVAVPAAVPPTVEPNALKSVQLVSETYAQPTVIAGVPYADSNGTPWLPTSVGRQVWATQLQLLVDGQDVTFFRNVPSIIDSWASQEPFGDSSAVFQLPAVTTFDAVPEPAALPTGQVVGIAASHTGNGYWQASAQGLVSTYGDANYYGDPLGLLNQPVSGIAANPAGTGYALVAQDGGVFTFGVAFQGSLPGVPIIPAAPVIGIAMTSTGLGYWMVTADGTVYGFGDAPHNATTYLATSGNASVGYPTHRATGIARSAGGNGYIVVANNGGVFTFGDAVYHGNPISAYVADFTGIATLPGVDGYLIVNALGDAYCFGAVPYKGGMNRPLNQPVNSCALTPDNGGYWMSAGDGGIFTFGDAAFLGSIPGGGINIFGSLSWLRLGAPVTINYIDPGSAAHTLWEGVVADWDDTTGPGQVGLTVQCTGSLFQADWLIAKPIVDMPFIGFDPYTNLPVFGWDVGTAVAHAFNSAHNPTAGTAIANGPQPAPRPSAFNFGYCQPVTTGALTVVRGNWDKLASGYMQNILAQAQNAGLGTQWTVQLQRPRTPVIINKNTSTTNWTVSSGGRGVAHQLSRDQSSAATAIYGQGTAPPVLAAQGATSQALTGSWQGTKYPKLPGLPPAFPLGTGQAFTPGGTATGFLPFSTWMRTCGYPLVSQGTYVNTDPVRAILDLFLIEKFQQNAGIQVTGNVDQTTWNLAFATGQNEGAVANVYYEPLWQLAEVEPYTYTPSGAFVGNNPVFNPVVPRIERFEQMGQQITKAQGVVSAVFEGGRVQTPAWTGTIILTADPQEGSRFQILAGQNIMMRWFHGRDTLFHISEAEVDVPNQSVTLTVSSAATDLMTLAAIYSRDSQAHGVARTARPSLVSLNVSSNTTVFDSESGAGLIPAASVTGGSWTVLRVPFSESGQVALADLASSPATPFSVGVFSGPVTPGQLLGVFGSAGPQTADATGNNPWNDFALTGADGGTGLDGLGMLYGAGGPNGACGYWPSDPSGVQSLTGRYLDAQTWPYASAPGYIPWLWVALWAPTSCTISGRFLIAPPQNG